MYRLELNHYNINGSKINISLPHYYVEVEQVIYNNNCIYYEMSIIDNNRKSIKLVFNSLEEAISFIETKVNKSSNLLEIMDIYNSGNLKSEKKI